MEKHARYIESKSIKYLLIKYLSCKIFQSKIVINIKFYKTKKGTLRTHAGINSNTLFIEITRMLLKEVSKIQILIKTVEAIQKLTYKL